MSQLPPELTQDREGKYGSDTYSITKCLASPAAMAEDYFMQVAQGQISGAETFNKFGRNADVGTEPEDVWSGGGIWVAPTADRIHDIESTSASDAAAGTGGRILAIEGLSGGILTTEVVTLDGGTPVPTVKSYGMIHRMRLLSVGSGGTNAGEITATAQTDGTVTAHISIGNGQTAMAIFQVPSNQTLFITTLSFGLNRATPGVDFSGDLILLLKETTAVDAPFLVKAFYGLGSEGTSVFLWQARAPYNVPPLSTLKIRIVSSTTNVDVSAGFDGILVDN